ncbi:MAG TPA: hemerythrin domain-containing protein [Acidimicrobiia bacterium]|nr:hemerythrin domain-containing protein [Acidimicrobiia bacterium]
MTAVLTPIPTRVSFDLYQMVHKGLRRALFQSVEIVGQATPSRDDEISAAADQVREVVFLLDHHAQHEDASMDSLIAQYAPGAAARIRVDHQRYDSRIVEIEQIATRLERASTAVREDVVIELYRALTDFLPGYLEHMAFEDQVVMPTLAAALSVEELIGVQQAIVSSIPPDVNARFMQYMLAAANEDERATTLAGIREGAPPEAFAGIAALTERVVTPTQWARVAARLDLA